MCQNITAKNKLSDLEDLVARGEAALAKLRARNLYGARQFATLQNYAV